MAWGPALKSAANCPPVEALEDVSEIARRLGVNQYAAMKLVEIGFRLGRRQAARNKPSEAATVRQVEAPAPAAHHRVREGPRSLSGNWRPSLGAGRVEASRSSVEAPTEEWLAAFSGRQRRDDRQRFQEFLAEIHAPEAYRLAAQDRLTEAAGRRRELATAIVEALRGPYGDLRRTAAAKKLSSDWSDYLRSEHWLQDQDPTLPAGDPRRVRTNLRRLSLISDVSLSWQRIDEIAAAASSL